MVDCDFARDREEAKENCKIRSELAARAFQEPPALTSLLTLALFWGPLRAASASDWQRADNPQASANRRDKLNVEER